VVRRSIIVMAVLVLALGACGSDDPEQVRVEDREAEDASDASTKRPSFLARAATETLEAESGRVEMTMTFAGDVDGTPIDASMVMTGSYDSAVPASSLTMDMSSFLDELAAQTGEDDGLALFGEDMTIETVQVGSTVYMRMPFLDMIGDLVGADTSDLSGMWVAADLSEMNAEDLEAMGGSGITGLDPAAFLELAQGAGGEVEELGTVDVRGTSTTGYRVEITVADAVAMQGEDASELESQLDLLGAEGIDELVIPMELYVDDDDRVRRVVTDMSFGDVAAAMPDMDAAPSGDFAATLTVDFYDFGAPDIVIEAPPADAVIDADEMADLFGTD
jgi:hypothetical protein